MDKTTTSSRQNGDAEKASKLGIFAASLVRNRVKN